MIPNHFDIPGSNHKGYIYSIKGAYPKGANRFCTTMYSMVKAIKNSGTPAAASRHLAFIGDSFAENKCNVNLAFASDLVRHGWYDVVEFLYGPVGHTHNGIDATHKTHNQSLGRY